MPRTALFAGALLAALAACLPTQHPKPVHDYTLPLPEGVPALIAVPAEQWPDMAPQWNERDQLLPALRASIDWFALPSSQQVFPVAGIDHERASESLLRFERALVQSRSAAIFGRRLARDFELYRSAGWDGRGGGVLFTGYCTPIVNGRRERDEVHRWPLYSLPSDLVKAADGSIRGQRRSDGSLGPYPDRLEIETNDLLAGLELIWLADPLDAFLAHVNGSVVVRLADGSLSRYGYAGKNGRPYASLRQHLIESGAVSAADAGLPSLRAWAAAAPLDTVLDSLRRNPSFVFFRQIDGLPRGSMNLPVTAGRTLATDKSVFPRGGLVFVDTELPSGPGSVNRPFQRFMLDQDTGGAIKSAGRADIYLGSGLAAERVAGSTAAEGQLYYLFARE